MQTKIIQAKFLTAAPVRTALPMIGHPSMTLQARGGASSFAVDPVQLGLNSGPGKPLPSDVRAHMEGVFNADFSDVRVHVGSQAARIGAIAFTTGSDIYFAPGKFQPQTAAGRELLGHELAHVLQQKAGRVRNSTGAGVAVVHDQLLEAEADRMGQRAALQGKFGMAGLPVMAGAGRVLSGQTGASIQRRTAITFNRQLDRPGSDSIGSLNHWRIMHWGTHRSLAAYLSGYNNVVSATTYTQSVCNHYVSYKMVADAVETKLKNLGDLDHVAAWLNNVALPGAQTYNSATLGFPKAWTFSVGAIPQPNITSTNVAGTNFYKESKLNSEIDDFIFNLANDPRNLFYWNKSSGDNGGASLDTPQGPGNSYASLHTVVNRLNAYRQALQGLGLAV